MSSVKKINFGRFQADLTACPDTIIQKIELMYGDAPIREFSDFSVSLKPGALFRRWFKPNVVFQSNDVVPFMPLPLSQAYAFLEWGLNWCVATHDYNHLLVHSAVLVKNGQAIIFPALPGSGKSTLTCWLGLHGWDVYSDEMAVINTDTLMVEALYRPICVKNQSIDLVKKWSPDITITDPCYDTAKGTVAHVKVQDWNAFAQFRPVPVTGVVFPKYDKDVQETLYSIDQLQVFEALCKNSFNYHVIGEKGFHAVAQLAEKVNSLEVHYNDLAFLSELLEEEILR